MRGRDQAAPFWEPAALGTEIDHRRPLGPGRWEPPAQLHQLHAVLAASKNGRGLGRPDVLPRLEIWGCCREDDRRANLTECFQIGAVWNMVTEVVAHLSMRRHSINQLVLDLDRDDTTMSSAPAPDGLLPALAELLLQALGKQIKAIPTRPETCDAAEDHV